MHPKGLCGEWRYEYKLPYSPYGNQCLQERYLLLSCGVAYKSLTDKYDEGSDYFNERRTSGWGRWFVQANEELVIICDTVTSNSVGGAVCGNEGPVVREDEYNADTELRENCKTFVAKFSRQGPLDEMDEEKFRGQMRYALQNMPPKAMRPHCPLAQTKEQGEEEDSENEEKERKKDFKFNLWPEAQLANPQPSASSKVFQKQGTLSSLRRIFSRNKRQRL